MFIHSESVYRGSEMGKRYIEELHNQSWGRLVDVEAFGTLGQVVRLKHGI
jgi:hypothetical protein